VRIRLFSLSFTKLDYLNLKASLLVSAYMPLGIYADELFYIGKTKSLRGLFSGGHKAFLWAWLGKYHDEDVRIVVELIAHWGNPTLLLELEAIILRATIQLSNSSRETPSHEDVLALC
jgi:hypothetical protein